MAAIIPIRTSGNISAHGRGHKVFIGICGIRRIVMQIYTSINLGHGLACENGFNKASQESLLGKRYNIEMPMIFCSAAP